MDSTWHKLTPVLVASYALLSGCGDEEHSPRIRSANGADTGVDDACLSWCAAPSGACTSAPEQSYPGLADTLAAWTKRCPDAGQSHPFLVRGQCNDGTSVLYTGSGKVSESRYFDAQGVFVAAITGSDFGDATCQGRHHWPKDVTCEGAVVSEIICGTALKLGTPI